MIRCHGATGEVVGYGWHVARFMFRRVSLFPKLLDNNKSRHSEVWLDLVINIEHQWAAGHAHSAPIIFRRVLTI